MPLPTKVDHAAYPQDEHHFQGQPFRFLDLPPEARHAIYDCCLTADSDDDTHQIQALRKRGQPPKPLRLVCHQINDELTPLFFRTATFKVDSKRGSPNVARTHYNHPASFENLFLRNLPGHKMRNIRKLSYNANVEARIQRIPGDVSPLASVDFDGLLDFTDVLSRYGDALECLQEVQLYAEPRKVYGQGHACYILINDLAVYSANPLSVKHTALYAWDMMDHRKHWESVESKLGGGVLKGWNVSRMVSLIPLEGSSLISFVRAIVVTFNKPVVAPQADTDCHTVVETRAERFIGGEGNTVSTWATKQRRPIDGV